MKPLHKSDRQSFAEYTQQGGEICKYGHISVEPFLSLRTIQSYVELNSVSRVEFNNSYSLKPNSSFEARDVRLNASLEGRRRD